MVILYLFSRCSRLRMRTVDIRSYCDEVMSWRLKGMLLIIVEITTGNTRIKLHKLTINQCLSQPWIVDSNRRRPIIKRLG
jgi:hypothetical protein